MPPELQLDTWIVIAAYQEARVIAQTVSELRGHFSNIVVVDDGSSDQTATEARNAGAHVCVHPINLGQGAALQTGIAYALLRNAASIITFDADGQHSPEDAITIAGILREGNYDAVLSSRFLGTTVGMPLLKRLLLRTAIRFTRWTSGLPVTDTHNGLRGFTRAAAQRFEIRQNRMAHASEILSVIAQLKLRWREIPGTVRYTPYSIGKGQKLSGALIILEHLLAGKLRS